MRIPTDTRGRRLRLPFAALLIVGALAAGCGGSDAPRSGTTPAAPTVTTAAATVASTSTGPERTVTVYFSDPDGQRVVAATRTVATGGSDLRAALVALAAGPTEPGAVGALPSGTVIVGTNVAGGEALINVSRDFLDGYPSGGAAAEFAVLAPLVYTATAVPGVDRVRVTVDGQVPEPVGSQYDWSGAFTRNDFPGAAG